MLQEAQKQAGSLMAQLGYDIQQSQMKAVPEFGLPALSFPSQRRQQMDTSEEQQHTENDDLDMPVQGESNQYVLH